MTTRWETMPAATALKPEDFIYLTDGPRAGDTLLAPQHSGKICLAPVANGVPRLGSELLYEPTTMKTSEGARCYRLVVRKMVGAEE